MNWLGSWPRILELAEFAELGLPHLSCLTPRSARIVELAEFVQRGLSNSPSSSKRGWLWLAVAGCSSDMWWCSELCSLVIRISILTFLQSASKYTHLRVIL